MRTVRLLILLPLALILSAQYGGVSARKILGPSYRACFDFRQTSGYVSDPSPCTYVLATDTSSTTRGGSTFQWTGTPVTAANRTTSVDHRLAGINYKQNTGTQITWTLTLPATGTYKVRLAIGDTGVQARQYLVILDNATPVLTINDADGTAANGYLDATGTEYTSANWPSSNQPVNVTFASTTLKIVLGTPTGATAYTTLAHFYLEK